MKPSIVILVVLGLIAAVSMALLTATMGGRSAARPTTEPQAKVLVAVKQIEPLTPIGQDLLQVRMVSLKQAPANAYNDPVQVAGRILSVPLAAGQALTPTCFVPKGVGVELATQLPNGMRAVTVSLNLPASLQGLLYPGSVVDVIASFQIKGGNAALGEAVSTTLLENVQILAVDNEIASRNGATGTLDAKGGKTSKMGSSSNLCLVTFKVDSRQAEGLQLAAEFGKVSLAMRNPLDHKPIDQDPTLLSQGKLAGIADLLNSMVKQRPGEEPKEPEVLPPPEEPKPEPQIAPVEVAIAPEPQGWKIEAFRGVTRETISIPTE